MSAGGNRHVELRRLERARTGLERAQAERRQAAVDAHTAGVPIAAIARLLGVTRVTIYRWLEEAGD